MNLLVPGVFICVVVALTLFINRYVNRERPAVQPRDDVPEPDEYFRRGKHPDDIPDPAFVEQLERDGKIW